MRILGLTFAGTSTAARTQMSQFLGATFGLQAVNVGGVDADVFDVPDGSSFAVADTGGMGTDRSIGFLVEGLEEAIDRLRELGLEVDTQITANVVALPALSCAGRPRVRAARTADGIVDCARLTCCGP